MKNLAYYNGKISSVEEMTIPFNDRVHFFGDGIYDVTYARGHKPFALSEHLDRLYGNAVKLDIRMPMPKEELTALMLDLISQVDDGDQFLYLQVTRGTQDRLHTYPEDMVGNLWIMIRPGKIKDIYAEVKAITAEDTRFFHCDIKTLNLLPAVMYSQMAQRAGVFETILYRKPDRVTECAHANVHIIDQKGAFRTAPTDNLILPGIARAHLIKACRALGYEVDETPFTLEELMNAKEVIISSSSVLGARCIEIDGQAVGGQAPEMLRAIQTWVYEEFMNETK